MLNFDVSGFRKSDHSIIPGRNSMPPHRLRCREVWGGNGPVFNKISAPGIDVTVSSIPAEQSAQGGDVYYLSGCGCGLITRLAIADVSGHGPPVADVANCLRLLMRKHVDVLDQTELAVLLNKEFGSLPDMNRFATALLAAYFPPTRQLVVCNIGHPPPLWYQSGPGQWRVLRHDITMQAGSMKNVPLGLVDAAEYVQFTVGLAEGDMVLIYSDALIESRSASGAELGIDGLIQLANACTVRSPSDVGLRLLESLSEHRGGKPSRDDQTLLLLSHHGGGGFLETVKYRFRSVARMMGLVAAD